MRTLKLFSTSLLLIVAFFPASLYADIVFDRPGYERTYALVVGIDRYSSPKIPTLHGSEIDARGFLSIITDKDTGVVDSKDAYLLVNEAATRANIIDAIKRIRQSLKENENFIFYFSGHAAQVQVQTSSEREGFTQLISYDGRDPDLRVADISFETDIVPLASTDKGYFIFISDACSVADSVIGRVNVVHPKVGVLSATKQNQAAMELAEGGGVMTVALLKALSDPDSDLDGDGLITLEEAHNRVYREVLISARDRGSPLENPSVSGQYIHKMVVGRVSRRALENRKRSGQEPGVQPVTLTWPGHLDLQLPLKAILNGSEEPNLEIRQDNEKSLITFLGPPALAEQIKSGANSLAVIGKQKLKAASESFLIFKEEKGNLLLKQSPFGHSYAVIIALSDYRGTGYPSADGMVDLAKHLADDLSKQGFEIKPFYDKEATTVAIDTYLREDLGPRLKPDDRVLIYYGGHGETVAGPGSKDVGYLVTAGATKGSVQTKGLPMKRIRSEYMDLLPAKHVLFLLDACFSGLSLLEPPPSESQIRDQKLSKYREIDALASERMRGIITAGRKQDRAINENGGLFTRVLRDAIKGDADYDGNGVITLEELYCYLWTKVGDRALAEGHEQQPQKELLSDYGAGSFLFLYR